MGRNVAIPGAIRQQVCLPRNVELGQEPDSEELALHNCDIRLKFHAKTEVQSTG